MSTPADPEHMDREELVRALRFARYMERSAHRHAVQKDAEIAEAEVTVARRDAEKARLHARIAELEAELHDFRTREEEGWKPPGNPAAALRKVAAGRAQYLKDAPDSHREALELQVHTLEQAARIAAGDHDPLYELLPSHEWTLEMVAQLHADEEGHRPPADKLTVRLAARLLVARERRIEAGDWSPEEEDWLQERITAQQHQSGVPVGRAQLRARLLDAARLSADDYKLPDE